jgi:hypothetical protein
MDIKQTAWKAVEWSHLAQTGEYWLVFMSTAINFRVRQNDSNFPSAYGIISFQEGFCSTELVISLSISVEELGTSTEACSGLFNLWAENLNSRCRSNSHSHAELFWYLLFLPVTFDSFHQEVWCK